MTFMVETSCKPGKEGGAFWSDAVALGLLLVIKIQA